MATTVPHNPTQHTFIDNKPPMLPRQSTSDVLSFTQIIADRLGSGQNVWDYFSPAPEVSASPLVASPSASPAPTSPVSPSYGLGMFSKRQSIILDASIAPQSIASLMDNNGVPPTAPMTKAQKRKSFAQSLRSMLSLSQLLSPTKAAAPVGPPHYNILVLGSDSAPLASTLYKMSNVLPSTTKISHYQEISGFFVAYFRSNGSFTCSPKSSTELSADKVFQFRECGEVKSRRRSNAETTIEDAVQELTMSGKKEKPVLTPLDTSAMRPSGPRRSSEESAATLTGVLGSSDDASTLSRASTRRGSSSSISAATAFEGEEPQSPSAKANASLSVHAFSLDTTWPVPRQLAQTFWFPHAHGMIYIVDATRKNDPRGMDHLINARQFLASLMADTTFKRRDIPVVVFANKAGLDETCFRVDEIADILGCEDWDGDVVVTGGDKEMLASRAWCVKSTRSDGDGDGLRESVEWLKSRMGEVWKI
ncbi:hypothetical protein BGZ81_009114 [Podila clonocystis]|nr:hypothetical protein BGZ81_009114 [Podila clonocystis]